MNKDLLRKLPSIDVLLKELGEVPAPLNREFVTELLRELLEQYRDDILEGKRQDISKEDILENFKKKSAELSNRNLKKVINATGIIVHTNLGRSILSKEALDAMIDVCSNYNNLEYNLDKGERGSRYIHSEKLLERITGAEASLVVNNNAAAVLLALNTLCKGKEAIVSRGQLVEIGGAFRVPEVMEMSGAALVEVGTTNKTHLYDYERAINENTGVLLKVHASNFKIIGFTETVSSEALAELGNKNGIPVIEDIGSGVLVDFSAYGFNPEVTVQQCINSGVDVVTFSGDKMLGGPQCGIIIGKRKYISEMKKNQLLRALRVDKTCLAALEATLLHYLNEREAVEKIPTLNMILSPAELHKKRGIKLKRKLSAIGKGFKIEIKSDVSLIGGGAMPGEKIDSCVLSIKHISLKASNIEKLLRNYEIPIIVRINNDEVLLDLRTIKDGDFDIIVKAFCSIKENEG